MSNAIGSMRCPVCGYDKPHGHSEDELHIERVVRPAFEAMALKFIQGKRESWWTVVKNPGNGYGHAPNSVGGYPASFGWHGVEQARTFGGDIVYTETHWAHRRSINSGYTNHGVQMIWEIYLDIHSLAPPAAGQSEPVAPYCWQECAEDGTPFFDEGTFASTPDAFDYSRPLYIGGAGQSPTVPTAELLFGIANELHGEFDKQTYDEKRRAEWDLQDGYEFSVSITFKQERALSQAIYQFEKARAALRSTLPQTTGDRS